MTLKANLLSIYPMKTHDKALLNCNFYRGSVKPDCSPEQRISTFKTNYESACSCKNMKFFFFSNLLYLDWF